MRLRPFPDPLQVFSRGRSPWKLPWYSNLRDRGRPSKHQRRRGREDDTGRDFVKGAAFSAAVAAGSGLLTGCSSDEEPVECPPCPTAEPAAAAEAAAVCSEKVYSFEIAPDPVADSDIVLNYISEGWENLYGGKLEFIDDPDEMIASTLAHIDKKRAELGLPVYDPSEFGRSGDTRMLELEQLPLAERREALYGVAAD